MWSQTYTPVLGSLALSALVAALPLFALLFLLGVARKPAWFAAAGGLFVSLAVSMFVYGMPVRLTLSAAALGAANGLLPIGWIVFTAILLYRLTVETGKFEIIKNSLGGLTSDQRLQALLIAFAFGAFIEGAAGFGTPVAVAAAMLTGLGFEPFYAAAICLLANTAPVAFGSIATPLIMLQRVTDLPMMSLSSNVGRICAPLSLLVPSYLVLVMGGLPALRAVAPAAVVCGVSFAGVQFIVSNLVGPFLTDILASLAAILALIVLFRVWRPAGAVKPPSSGHSAGELIMAWAPYGLLVVFVLLWGVDSVKALLDRATILIHWPGLDNQVLRLPPITPNASPYAATYALSLLSASGTSCLFAVFSSAIVLRVRPATLARYTWDTARQMALPLVTIASTLALAFVMNYSGATATLGLMFATTGVVFPFFSAMLGWIGVFLTGSDTSANALFGNLQVVTATHLGLNPALIAAANSSGGVMGKMISLQNIAVAAAATGMVHRDEGRLFRFTLRHSVFLAGMVGVIVIFYAYGAPGWVK